MTFSDFYGRKSTLDDGRSIAGQEDDWRADCAQEGLTPARVFADPDRSASRYARKKRDDYAALVAHIVSGQCEMISLWESSRGSRNLGEWVTFLDLCRKHGTLIRILSHGRTYDIRVRRDWRTLADEGVESADESEKISERVRRGVRRSASLGRPTGMLAYGFRRIYDERGNFVDQIEHPDQGPIVREIIEGIAARRSETAIAKALNARGVSTPRGRQWMAAHVRAIATRPAYAGLRVHQGKVVGPGCWKPIVDPEIWQRTQAILTVPGRRYARDTRLKHWLSGAIRCGKPGCGGLLGARNNNNDLAYGCRRCQSVIARAEPIEAFLEPIILGRLQRSDAAELFLPATDDAALAAATAELEALGDRLAEFRAEGEKPDGLSAAAVATAERGLIPRIEAARARIRSLTMPLALADLAGVDVVAEWPTMGPPRRRGIVRALADLMLLPGGRNGSRGFDRWRLADSRWTGDPQTWGEIWMSEGIE